MHERAEAERNRCAWHLTSPTGMAVLPADCGVPNWTATTPVTEGTLGSRRFIVPYGARPFCVEYTVRWRNVNPSGPLVDTGTNQFMRLQRTVTVQWKSSATSTEVRKRELNQIGSMPVDALSLNNPGRLMIGAAANERVQIRPKGADGSAWVEVGAVEYQFGVGSKWFVNFPFLPTAPAAAPDSYELRRVSAAGVAQATSFAINLTDAVPTRCLPAGSSSAAAFTSWSSASGC